MLGRCYYSELRSLKVVIETVYLCSHEHNKLHYRKGYILRYIGLLPEPEVKR